MNALLQEIVDRAVYRQDYEDITRKLLFEDVSYMTAISAVQKIIDGNIF